MTARMRMRVLVLALSVTAAGCGPTDHRVVLNELRAELAGQYHECVPLGWSVAPEHGVALPGTSVEVNEYGNGRVWLPSTWLARIGPRGLARADVRTTERLLDALTRRKLLRRDDDAFGKTYHLTQASLPYYFAENRFGSDPDALSYLCYSSIVLDTVLRTEPVHVERSARGDEEVFRAEFAWHGGPVADWAQDPFIRSHGVVLTPTRSPAIAKFVHRDGAWTLTALSSSDAGMPLVIDVSAWPRASGPPRS